MMEHLHRRTFLSLVFAALFCSSVPLAYGTPVATTTTLTVSSGGSPVTSAPWGPVTLTASVSAGTAKVTVGQVKFCDASASFCLDAHLLGTAQLTSAGTAVMKFVPPPGNHSYKALFVGTKTMAGGASAATSLTVTGPFPSAISQTSVPSDPIVTVGGGTTEVPTGTVSLVNSTTGAVIATQTLSSGGPEFIRSEASDLNVSAAQSAVVGDFNNDGFADIAEFTGTGVTVLLGNGTGHFKASSPTPVGANVMGQFLLASDFNGDGVLDLALAGGFSTPLVILLGNGDGTFTQAQIIEPGDGLTGLVTGDFNADGIPDLAFSLSTSTTVFVYLGNGDGTFTGSPLAPPSTGSSTYRMLAGDFNGDGISDLAAVSEVANQTRVAVFLSNGDGSFSAPIVNGTAGVNVIAACDLNSDGHLDLAVSAGFTTTILLGDGIGNFSTGDVLGVPTNVRGGPTTLACADFNGDGAMDLVFVLEVGTGTESGIFIGDGAGNFAGGGTTQAWTPLAEGDFNGDGLADIVDQSQRLVSATQTGNADFSTLLTPGSGSPQVVASYSGDSNYAASTSAPFSIQAPQGTPTVSVTAPSVSITEGTPLTVTVSGGGLVPTGSVTVYDGSAVLGTFTLNSAGIATISATTLASGTNSITASYAGDANYVAATSAPLTITVSAPGSTASSVSVKPASSTVAAGQALAVSVAVSGPAGGASPSGSVNLATGSYTAWQTLSNGAASFTLPAGALSSGSNTLTATYPGDPVYAAGNATATVTVSPVSIAVPAPVPVSAGASTTATVTITSGSTYQGTLNLTCALTSSPSSAQSPPTCTMNPASVAIASGSTGTTVITVKTTAASTASLREPLGESFWRMGGGGSALALLFTCGICSRRRRRWISMLALLLVFAISATVACGGGGNGGSGSKGSGTPATTAGAYVFTVTGTDASTPSISATTTVSITVQ